MTADADHMDAILYPASPAYNAGLLAVDDVHSIYYEEFGNKSGIPIVYLHGGPGFGASPYFHRFFDPAAFRIVVYDQRGAPRTNHPGETKNNSPASTNGMSMAAHGVPPCRCFTPSRIRTKC